MSMLAIKQIKKTCERLRKTIGGGPADSPAAAHARAPLRDVPGRYANIRAAANIRGAANIRAADTTQEAAKRRYAKIREAAKTLKLTDFL